MGNKEEKEKNGRNGEKEMNIRQRKEKRKTDDREPETDKGGKGIVDS